MKTLNVELFKEQYELLRQKLSEIASLPHSPSEYNTYNGITVIDDEIELCMDSWEGNKTYTVRFDFLHKSKKELQEIFNEEYNKRMKFFEDGEKRQYERLKAKFENER